MKILLMMVVVQSLNMVVFAWLDRLAFMRILALRQKLCIYKRKLKRLIRRWLIRSHWEADWWRFPC